MLRYFPLIILWLFSMVIAAPAWATSQEDISLSTAVHSAPATQLLQATPTQSIDSPNASGSSEEPPELSKAFNSLYMTKQERARHEGKALALAFLGSTLSLAVGIGASFLTLGLASILVPPLVAFATALILDSQFDTPFGKVLMGAFGGIVAGSLVGGAMFFLAPPDNNFLTFEASAGIGIVAVLTFTAFGAWIAAISGQDGIERRRLVILGPTPSGIHGQDVGVGVLARF